MTRIEIAVEGTLRPTGREARLARAIAALAEQPPSAEQARRNPPAPGMAEGLVFEFDEAYTSFVEGFVDLPSEAQLLALQAVDTEVSKMVGARRADLWSALAHRESSEWHRVRTLAEAVLREFGWQALSGA